jgi:hypothetical protein
MDAYFIEIKNVADVMEGVNVRLSEGIVVYYMIKNLSKEYEVFYEV